MQRTKRPLPCRRRKRLGRTHGPGDKQPSQDHATRGNGYATPSTALPSVGDPAKLVGSYAVAMDR